MFCYCFCMGSIAQAFYLSLRSAFAHLALLFCLSSGSWVSLYAPTHIPSRTPPIQTFPIMITLTYFFQECSSTPQPCSATSAKLIPTKTFPWSSPPFRKTSTPFIAHPSFVSKRVIHEVCGCGLKRSLVGLHCRHGILGLSS